MQFFLAGWIFSSSCKKEYSYEGCLNGNKPPIANAGTDQVITLPTDSVSLDGRQSSDPDGTISGFLWTKISGPVSFTIIKPADSITKVKALVAGVCLFELKVTDNGGLSAKDTVQVIVIDLTQPNRPPVANAGSDQIIILPTNTANLDGSGSTDPDNNITNYLWAKISRPSSFNIANANVVQTQVTSLVEGVYQFELKVTDAGGLSAKDTVKITVCPFSPPPASCNAGARPLVNAQLLPIGTLSEERRYVTITAAGAKVLFAGGTDVTDGSFEFTRVDIYDTVTYGWSTSELSVPRYNMQITTFGNKIFFSGVHRFAKQLEIIFHS